MKHEGISKRTFAKLNMGRFMQQVNIYNPRKLNNRKRFLGNRHSMSEKKRASILKQQMKKYYGKSTRNFHVATAPPSPPSPSDPFDKFASSETRRAKDKEKLRDSDQWQKTNKRKFRK